MKIHYLIAAVLSFTLCSETSTHAQDLDSTLSGLADNLAAQIKDHGNKKVTVLDFTDLQGGSSELGRYIAEQLTVDLVMGKRDFAVLDRANLKSILAEHKLTAEGLVDPDNAKKLGQFAGVDALVIGNLMPMNSNIQLTVKIITTDTAQIVGAARTNFAQSAETTLLLQKAVTPVGVNSATQEPPKRDFDGGQTSYDFGPLNVTLDSFRVLQSGEIVAVLFFKNIGTNNEIRVALNHEQSGSAAASLIDDQGNQYQVSRNVEGLNVRSSPGYWSSPTDSAAQVQAKQDERTSTSMAGATSIQTGGTIPATIYFSRPFGNAGQIGPGFRLQCGFTVALKGRFGRDTFKEETLFIQGIQPHSPSGQ